MAKPLEQRKQEASWRHLRTELLFVFGHYDQASLVKWAKDTQVSDHLRKDAQNTLDKQQELLSRYMAIPAHWRETAMAGKDPDDLLTQLMKAAEAQLRLDTLSKTLPGSGEAATKPRM